MTKRTDTAATARRTSAPAQRRKTPAADKPHTDREIVHLANVAAQAATVRALERQRREARAGLDRLMIAAYRAGVKVTHLAEAAQFSRDTVHDAVRPWANKRKKDTTHDQDKPLSARRGSTRAALPGAGDHAEGLGTAGRVAALPRPNGRKSTRPSARTV